MPARDEEIKDAQEEGLNSSIVPAPVLLPTGWFSIHETFVMRLCAQMNQEDEDRKLFGSGYEVAADLFILAIGQEVDIPDEGLEKLEEEPLKPMKSWKHPVKMCMPVVIW